MTYRFHASVATALLLAAAAPRPVNAGAEITYELRSQGAIAPILETTRVSERFVRTETDGHITIYDADTDLHSEFDKRKLRYFQVSTRQMSSFIGEVLARRRSIVAALDRIPAADRWAIERILLMRNVDIGAPLEARYASLGRTETVGSWRCRAYEMHLDGEKMAEFCVVPLADFGIRAEEMSAFNRMARAAAKLAATGSGYARMLAAGDPQRLDNAAGFPTASVRIVQYRDGRPAFISTLVALKRLALKPSDFAGPPGYERGPPPGGGGRAG